MSTRADPVEHGGTDAGPTPHVDASTNANPYGPSPTALAALRVDVGPYPDPAATSTRAALAAGHGCHPDEVVVGAGATELIDRLVRVLGGPVLTETPTFGEYAGAARRHGVEHRAADAATLLDALQDAAIAFVCSPGNPDGAIRSAASCERVATRAAATGTVLVWDLAYAPLVPQDVPVPDGTVALHAPNKAHGCTGLRAGWLRAPTDLADRLRAAAVTWPVSAPGLAFLTGTTTDEADAWVAEHTDRLRSDRGALVADLRALDLEVAHGAAPFVLVRAPAGWTSHDLATALRRDHGVKVRPTDSQGLPGWLRIAALPRASRQTLVDAVAELVTPGLAPGTATTRVEDRSAT
jgi:histidinol-phosphate aminotransferase